MKSLLALVVLLLASSALAQNSRRDGNWWNEQTKAEKLNYMIGFFDGMDLGRSFSFWGITNSEPDKACISKVIESYGKFADKYMQDVTNLQLVDGLDDFYKNYRNRKIKVANAVWLTLNAITGKPQNDLEKMIENFRTHAD